MPRIDIELTSTQPGGSWTWRAAGARQPKGVLEGSLLGSEAKVGDVLRAECEMDLDGTRVTAVLGSRTKRAEHERLTVQGSGQKAPLVTQNGGVPDMRGDRPRGDGRSDRRPGRERDGGPRPGRSRDTPGGGRGPSSRSDGRPGQSPRSEGRPGSAPRSDGRPGQSPQGRPGAPDGTTHGRGGRPSTSGERRSGRDDRGRDRRTDGHPRGAATSQPRGGRPEPPGQPRGGRRESSEPAARPRPKRIQAGRAHREAVLADLPPEQRAVAEKVLRGGLPSVRQAVEEQNAQARSTGAPEIRADALVAMAEGLLPRLRAADWRDRAEAAAADVDEIGLRDLRSVVAGSDAAARDDESRALVARLREALERRGAEECEAWVAEIRSSLVDGRVVRALRVSGRPPDPSARFPADLAEELSAAAGAAMTADTLADRWAALLDALVASPVRRSVKPQGVPAERPEDFESALRLAAPRVPALDALLGPPRPPRPASPSGAAPGALRTPRGGTG
ncbi:MAG: hypothetical protein ACR2HV_04985, partial [Acidimicrobiales bacterium]